MALKFIPEIFDWPDLLAMLNFYVICYFIVRNWFSRKRVPIIDFA